MRYVDILRKLLALGDKLPEVLEILQRIYPDVIRLIEIGKTALQGQTLFAEALSPEELEEAARLESEIEASIPTEHFAANGERIRSVIQFIAEHPQVLAVILSLL